MSRNGVETLGVTHVEQTRTLSKHTYNKCTNPLSSFAVTASGEDVFTLLDNRMKKKVPSIFVENALHMKRPQIFISFFFPEREKQTELLGAVNLAACSQNKRAMYVLFGAREMT